MDREFVNQIEDEIMRTKKVADDEISRRAEAQANSKISKIISRFSRVEENPTISNISKRLDVVLSILRKGSLLFRFHTNLDAANRFKLESMQKIQDIEQILTVGVLSENSGNLDQHTTRLQNSFQSMVANANTAEILVKECTGSEMQRLMTGYTKTITDQSGEILSKLGLVIQSRSLKREYENSILSDLIRSATQIGKSVFECQQQMVSLFLLYENGVEDKKLPKIQITREQLQIIQKVIRDIETLLKTARQQTPEATIAQICPDISANFVCNMHAAELIIQLFTDCTDVKIKENISEFASSIYALSLKLNNSCLARINVYGSLGTVKEGVMFEKFVGDLNEDIGRINILVGSISFQLAGYQYKSLFP
jgi:hypothetical protein